jgi:tetratricopeptide (TPR) repeat protein
LSETADLVLVAPHDPAALGLSSEILFRQQRYDDLLSSIDKFISTADNQSTRQLLMQNATALLEDYGKRLGRSKDAAEAANSLRDWGTRFLKRAEGIYRKCADEKPQQALALAAFLGREGRLGESLDILEREWRAARPKDIASFSQALLASTSSTEDLSRVEHVLRAALEKHDRPLLLIMALAELQNWREIFDEAEQLYREVLIRQDQHAAALNNLAVLLAIRGRGGQESIALIQKALEVSGQNSDLLDSRATIYLALGKFKSAASDLEQVIASQPNALSFMHQSQVKLRLGERAAARESLARARELGLRIENLHPLERPGLRRLQNELR